MNRLRNPGDGRGDRGLDHRVCGGMGRLVGDATSKPGESPESSEEDNANQNPDTAATRAAISALARPIELRCGGP